MNDALVELLRVAAPLALGGYGVLQLRGDLRRARARRGEWRKNMSGTRAATRRVDVAVRVRLWIATALVSVPALILVAVLVNAPMLAFYVLLGIAAVCAAAYLVVSVIQGLLEAVDD